MHSSVLLVLLCLAGAIHETEAQYYSYVSNATHALHTIFFFSTLTTPTTDLLTILTTTIMDTTILTLMAIMATESALWTTTRPLRTMDNNNSSLSSRANNKYSRFKL